MVPADDLEVERKGDGTPVTAADRAAERLLREQLAADFPDDGILGEEEAPMAGRSGRRWIIDPIDGTKAFTCGVPLYSTLLALEDEHGIAVGVIHLPALGETVWAGRGLGCWSDRGPARVSDARDARRRLRDVELVLPLDRRPASPPLEAAGAVLRTWGDGYGYALGGHRPGGGHGRPDRRALRRRPDAGAARRGRRPVHRPAPARPTIEGGSGLGTNGQVHDELLALLAG